MFYTVETFYGHGALESDYTRVYAHLRRDQSSERILVLSGGYLELRKVVWTSPHEDTFCLGAGRTDTFRNEVTLIIGNESETVRNHLDERCQ
jgi:hypothetical protein